MSRIKTINVIHLWCSWWVFTNKTIHQRNRLLIAIQSHFNMNSIVLGDKKYQTLTAHISNITMGTPFGIDWFWVCGGNTLFRTCEIHSLILMSNLNFSNNKMNKIFSIQDATMLQQKYLWRHSGAHTGVPLATNKQFCGSHYILTINTIRTG